MILEAFSLYLRQYPDPACSPEKVLFEWLTAILSTPPAPHDMIARVIHAEIELEKIELQKSLGYQCFEGKSNTGRKLLNSLVQYCRSYDHWQFCRWLHERKASDFTH